MQKDIIIIILCTIVLVVLMSKLIIDYQKGCESCNICTFDINETKFGVNGFYSTIGFYCIWTKDRTAKQIASVVEHEKCHALINKDYEHFC